MACPRQHFLQAAGVVADHTWRRAYEGFLQGLLAGQETGGHMTATG